MDDRIKLLYMPLWVVDIDTDRQCRRMSDAEFGRYMRLLIRQWMEGSVPADAADAVRDACLDHDAVDSVASLLDRKFSSRDGSERMNRRCQVEYGKSAAKVKRLRELGSEGGKANAIAHATANAKANALAGVSVSKSKSKSSESEGSVRGEFDRWWAAYPHKRAKIAAQKAYKAARKLTDADTLLAGVRAYVASKPTERAYLNPATWLNGGGWDDEPAKGDKAKPKTGIATLTYQQECDLYKFTRRAEPDSAWMPMGQDRMQSLMHKHLADWMPTA